ncbi:MAG: hypothetical protein H0X65_13500 [Gemmatimonadetes bacterium]|nr:hypothetical protein [Gemmatimonadota bacterium]
MGAEHGFTGAGDAGDLAFQTGLRLPIGVELHHSTGGFSVGGFLSLVDLGNVATVSFGDKVERAPEIGWITLFNPGIYAVLGLPKTPFSMMIGWSFISAGRETTAGEQIDIGRLSLVGAVDIPLLP